jgi:saccharopine dehydrogenase (NAD+, L-lysine forming)
MLGLALVSTFATQRNDMLHIGVIKEGKTPADTRVALTPAQCKFLVKNFEDIKITVQPCSTRCYSNKEYERAGIVLNDDLQACDLLLGIKEVPIKDLIANKQYLFFSHTKKKQPHNQALFHAMMDKAITLMDYECLEFEDGQRILGFGFFAGVVGAHNGIMAYGKKTGLFDLPRVNATRSFRELVHSYFHLKLPNIKIALTGSGRVASGLLEVMNLLGVIEVEPEEYLEKNFSYPVYVHLKGGDLYRHKTTGKYNRDDFHENPQDYQNLFRQYVPHTDLLMNGIYWDHNIPRLFEWEDLQMPGFRIKTIADVTDDANGSVPCNLGDSTIEDPVYGVDVASRTKTLPYLHDHVDVMAVGNLPNELPRDASRYFGEQLIKYVLDDIRKGGSTIIEKATLLKNGLLTAEFDYLAEYAKH